MLALVQFFVFYIIIPVLYIAIIIFDVLLIRSASAINKWRDLGGVIVGFLAGVVVILLDQQYGGLLHPAKDITSLDQIWPSVVIMSIVGFGVLLVIDFLIRRGVVPFIIMFTVVGIMVSIYYLVTLSQLRTLTAVGAIGFVIGTIIYFIIFPTRISGQLLDVGSDGL